MGKLVSHIDGPNPSASASIENRTDSRLVDWRVVDPTAKGERKQVVLQICKGVSDAISDMYHCIHGYGYAVVMVVLLSACSVFTQAILFQLFQEGREGRKDQTEGRN